MPKAYRLAVIPGDGVGPEVTEQALRVLEAASEHFGFTYQTTEFPFGADHYLATNEFMPADQLDRFREMDAIFLGAIGDPRLPPGLVERGVIAAMRFGLDLYINLRPIKLYAEHLCPLKGKKPSDIDMVVVRENTEDLYTGIGGYFKRGTPDEVVIANQIFTRKGCERAVRYAFELASKRPRKKLTLVDKANAIEVQQLWRRTVQEAAPDYPGVTFDFAYIDAACMWMVKNPESFDVIVTPNLFGDILTDLGAMIQGGMGVAASGNINPGHVSLFEPIHGSAPKYKGTNSVSPLAAIAAVGMMLGYLGEREAAVTVESAIVALLASARIPSLDAASGLRTSQIGDMVLAELPAHAPAAPEPAPAR
ncbi:MAG: 3-isopropylmalate dehydrogenase [Candidatus Eremiobacter antarcticus]|nr:3-isopropylmalate dehydrogenase [Candidatus Eremiobacteraeota bacterium]MBC5808941.1 3-isopropylmalate dehydrogenase [Candidatus Eremiobacteraeota bacterium]PZR60379.1 MAG: 3-isopropylmalate dehydrogenase [Candidatus Eremiobacter sp. RRmetagenome_bin22]